MTSERATPERAKTLTNESLFLARSLYEAHWTALAHRDKGYVCPNCLVYLRLIESIKALESEPAQRRARDTEIASKIGEAIELIEGPPTAEPPSLRLTSALTILKIMKLNLEATPTSAGAEKA